MLGVHAFFLDIRHASHSRLVQVQSTLRDRCPIFDLVIGVPLMRRGEQEKRDIDSGSSTLHWRGINGDTWKDNATPWPAGCPAWGQDLAWQDALSSS